MRMRPAVGVRVVVGVRVLVRMVRIVRMTVVVPVMAGTVAVVRMAVVMLQVAMVVMRGRVCACEQEADLPRVQLGRDFLPGSKARLHVLERMRPHHRRHHP